MVPRPMPCTLWLCGTVLSTAKMHLACTGSAICSRNVLSCVTYLFDTMAWRNSIASYGQPSSSAAPHDHSRMSIIAFDIASQRISTRTVVKEPFARFCKASQHRRRVSIDGCFLVILTNARTEFLRALYLRRLENCSNTSLGISPPVPTLDATAVTTSPVSICVAYSDTSSALAAVKTSSLCLMKNVTNFSAYSFMSFIADLFLINAFTVLRFARSKV